MKAKAMDIVKPAPKTALEAWERNLDALFTLVRTRPYAERKKIEVK